MVAMATTDPAETESVMFEASTPATAARVTRVFAPGERRGELARGGCGGDMGGDGDGGLQGGSVPDERGNGCEGGVMVGGGALGGLCSSARS
eukprot:5442343-Prymnesium_polylepis.2